MSGRGVRKRGRPPKSASSQRGSRFNYQLLKKPKYLMKGSDSQFSTPSLSRGSSPQESETSRKSISRAYLATKSSRGRGRRGKSVNTSTSRRGYESEYHYGSDFGDSTDKSDAEDDLLISPTDEESLSINEESESEYSECSFGPTTGLGRPPRPPSPEPVWLQDRVVSPMEIPPSSEDLMLSKEHVLEAVAIYEVLRRFRNLVRLSPFRLEDFCAALVSDEQSSLLTEVHLMLLKAILREEDLQATHFGPLDQKDSINITLYLIDHITWPEVLRTYIESDDAFDKEVLKILTNQEYPFCSIENRLSVLKFLTDQFLITTGVRDDMLQEGPIHYDDHCRICHRLGDLLCCETCPAVFHLECVDPPLTKIPTEDWQCNICKSHKTNGVSDCISQQEKQGLLIRQDILGYDRHGRKYWFVCRRIFVEDQGGKNIWYYSSITQLEQLLLKFDETDLEQRLCQEITDLKEEIERQMKITEILTNEQKGNKKSYLEIENERILKINKPKNLENNIEENNFDSDVTNDELMSNMEPEQRLTRQKTLQISTGVFYFKLGMENGFKTYVNQYTINPIALNKPQRNEERDKKRHLSHKFSLTTASAFKWIGGGLNSTEQNIVSTLRQTLLTLEQSITSPFMNQNWNTLKKVWLSSVSNCIKPVDFANILVLYQACLKNIVFANVWHEQLGHIRFQRITSVEREEKKKLEKREKRDREDEEERNRLAFNYVKYSLGLKHQVWKQKGEEYRIHGQWGWIWMSYSRRIGKRCRILDKINPIKIMLKVKKDNTEKVIAVDPKTYAFLQQSEEIIKKSGNYGYIDDFKNAMVLPVPETFDSINVSQALSSSSRLFYPKIARKSKLDNFLLRRMKLQKSEEQHLLDGLPKKENLDACDTNTSEENETQNCILETQTVLEKQINKLAATNKSGAGVNSNQNTGNVNLDLVNSLAKKIQLVRSQFSKLNRFAKHYRCYAKECNTNSNAVSQITQNTCYSALCLQKARSKKELLLLLRKARDIGNGSKETVTAILGAVKKPSILEQKLMEGKKEASSFAVADGGSEENRWNGDTPTNLHQDFLNALNNCLDFDATTELSSINYGVEEVKFETFDDCAEVTVKSEEIKSEDDVKNFLDTSKKNDIDVEMNEIKNVSSGVPLSSEDKILKLNNSDIVSPKVSRNNEGEIDDAIDIENSVSQFDDLLESDTTDQRNNKKSKTWKSNSDVSLTRSNENSLDNQLARKIKKDIDSHVSQVFAGKINRRFPITKPIKKESLIPKYEPELTASGIEKVYSTISPRGKLYLLHEYDSGVLKRKTSKNYVSKFPLIQSFLTHKLTKSLMCLQKYELLKLARLGGKGIAPGYNVLAKVNNTAWPYPCGRPYFRTCWLYRTATNMSLSAICLQFRILWCCLRWDDMTTKPPTSDGKHQVTTETEIVTTELLKLKHFGRFLEKTQYMRRKVTIPLEVPKTIREVTSIRSGLRKRKRAESPQQTEPQVTEEWVDEDKLELWEVKLFGEKQEKAVTRTVTGKLPLPKQPESSSSISTVSPNTSASGKTSTLTSRTPLNESKDKMEHQLKLQRAVQSQNVQKRVLNVKTQQQQQSEAPKPLIIGNRKVILKNPDGTTKIIHQPVSSTSVKTQLQVKSSIPTNKAAAIQSSTNSTPQQPTHQKVQIIRGSDGKVSVRGLSPGQQLIQMPDGKLHVLTTTPGSGNKTIALKPTASSPVLSKVIENKTQVKTVQNQQPIKTPNAIKQYVKPTVTPASTVKQQLVSQKQVQTQKVIVTGNQVIAPATNSVNKLPIATSNSQPIHKLTSSSVPLVSPANTSNSIQKITTTPSSNLQQIIIQPGQKILVGQNAQGQKVLISPSPQTTTSIQQQQQPPQQQYIVSSAQPVQQVQQVQQIHQPNVTSPQSIINAVSPSTGQQKVVQQIVNTSNVQQQIVYEGQRIVLNPGQAIVTRTLVQNQSPKPRQIQVVQQQLVQPQQQIQPQPQQQQQQQQIVIQNQATQSIIEQKSKQTQQQLFTQNHKKMEQPTQQVIQQKTETHRQQLVSSSQQQIHQQQREMETQKQMNAKNKQVVVQNSTVAQQLAQGKLQVATVNGQQVIIRPIGNNQAQIVAHIKTQSDGSSHIITNINAMENDVSRKQTTPAVNQNQKSPQQNLHQQQAQTSVISPKPIIQQQQIHVGPQTIQSTNLIQSESSVVQQSTPQQIYHHQTQQIKQQSQPQQQIQQQIIQNTNQTDLNNSIEQSLLHGQPPGTVIKCVTAQVIQTEHGPRIVLQGLAGNDFTPQQLALVQQQVKQQLLKAQESSGKQGVLGPTKIYLAVQPSTTTVNQQQQCQPPPLASVQTTLQQQLESCLPRPEILSGYQSLLDGVIIHSIWLQIDPEPANHPLDVKNLEGLALQTARAKNFDIVIRNLKSLYEEELAQTILILPDSYVLGFNPETRFGLEQMKLLLTLLLGAAVQCPNKEIFIARIKELDVNTQHGIVELIKQVTDNHSLVLTQESVELLTPNVMYNHIIRLTKERDNVYSKWINSVITESEVNLLGSESSQTTPLSPMSGTTSTASIESNHMAVELADLKSKLRRLRQELEEKSEAFLEIKEELDHKNVQYEKLRSESQEWYTEAKRASTYRDEVDVLRERAERADHLEIEVQKFREKLTDSEFYKSRVEELREDNRMLMETKDMLEDQLQRSRKRSEHVMSLESEIIKYKQKLNDMALERDVDRTKLQEILEENTQLQLVAKNLNATHEIDRSISENEDDCNSGDNSLSEQLTTSAQTRALKLELENRRLLAALDQLKESSFHESTNKILELEKEKKRLSLKLEQQQENCNRLSQQNKELEDVFRNALEENKKLQDAIDLRQKVNERQTQEREVERTKLVDLEKHVESLSKEKQRIQNLNESIQRRADDLDRLLDTKIKEVEQLNIKSLELDKSKNQVYDIETKLSSVERENISLSKEVTKLKENLETNSVQLDKNLLELEAQSKEVIKLKKDIEIYEINGQKLQELEQKNQELIKQREIDLQTIDTLRNDLVNGTLATNKVKQNLEKLGIDNTDIENSDINVVENVVEKLVKNPETFKTVREIMLNVCRSETNKSDMCVLCHRKEIFTVEKNIEISANNDCTENNSITFNDISSHKNKKENLKITLAAKWKEQCEQLNSTNQSLQNSNELLQAENARLNVDVATLGSQITSLNTQHVALQLANSQLAADKDLLLKQVESVKMEHKNLLHDQITLQCLHDQLNSEYESLNKDKETLKIIIRDLRNENRETKERACNLEKILEELRIQMSTIKSSADDLAILRAEHSKLTDDFRNLFATSDRFKNEYKNIQEQYKMIRGENSRLKLQNTELSGELNLRIDQVKSLEIEYTKVSQRCEMLLHQNSNLDIDRRTLMDNVSQLLSQYHELLTHSLEDKQHYHDEEKNFTDKVNSLNRQKEKLEEKIMETYKKSESCAPKKKAFGSSFVKRVKKASTDLINKVPSRNRRSWIDDSRLTQSQFALGSESGGNESDNSAEEQNSIASDTNLIQRNNPMRQSLQRITNDTMETAIMRGGIRSSLQSHKRSDLSNTRRNSVHGLEAPDVTGSSLTLGTAGSRRTVYLIDENQKLPDSQTPTPEAQTPTNPTSSSTGTSTGAPIGVGSNNIKNDTHPSTFVMYNRINTTIGGPLNENPISNDTNSKGSGVLSGDEKNGKKRTDDKASSIWYEYGCV